MKKLLKLFFIFFKISVVTIGGGYAMIPVIQEEIVNSLKYLKEEDFLNIFSCAQIIPGPIAVNVAILVGKKIAGIPGVIVSVLGVAIPPFVIIVLLSEVIMQFRDNIYLNGFLRGARIAVFALLANVGIKLLIKQKYDFLTVALILGLTFVAFYFNIISYFVILIGSFLFMFTGIILKKSNNKY